MGTWRCPHCRTVQVEGPRCFLCNRSATSCGTCINFRRSVVSTVGYCALDRQREPLSGEERRPCWAGSAPEGSEGLFAAAPVVDHRPDLGEAVRPHVPRPAARPRRSGLVELQPSRPVSRS